MTPTRPHVDVRLNGRNVGALYDSGADISCLSEEEFRRIPVDKRPQQQPYAPTTCRSASGQDLFVKGVYEIKMDIMGKTMTHPFRVIKNLSEPMILGADFIHAHLLAYNPKQQQVYWQGQDQWEAGVASVNGTIILPPFSSRLVEVTIITEQKTKPQNEQLCLVNVINRDEPLLMGEPMIVKSDRDGRTSIEVRNGGPDLLCLQKGDIVAGVENLRDCKLEALESEKKNETTYRRTAPSEKRKKQIEEEAKIEVQGKARSDYLQLLWKHHDVFSLDKSELGRSDLVMHEIQLKTKDPIYVKQFKIPDSHQDYLQEQVRTWLQLGIVQPSNSRYNSPLFLVTKKDGSFRVVQDFRALNAQSYVDKYSMKDVSECIDEIGKSESTLYTTLDLTSGFWQMLLHPRSREFTAFTVPGMGQFEWVTSAMGLLGCPSSFQRLVEAAVKGVNNVIVYIDDLIVHSKSHEQQLQQLDQLFEKLGRNNLKVNLKKCVFGSPDVHYLGFHLTPNGIKPGIDKLKAVKQARPPASVSEIRQFLGLCNFFRNHVKDFALVTAPLTRLTRKNAGWRAGPLPNDALQAFHQLQTILCSEPVLAFPRRNRPYALIVDAAVGDDKHDGGLGAILAQLDEQGHHRVVAYASRKLKDHEKNYSSFLLEMQAAVWGMEHFDVYLRGKHFTLVTDHRPLEKLGKVHTKTLNRLQQMMGEFSFDIVYRPGSEMPADFLSRHAVASLNLQLEQMVEKQDQDKFLKYLKDFLLNRALPADPATRNLVFQFGKDTFVQNQVIWRRIKRDGTERAVIMAPTSLIPQILEDAHGHFLSGHDGVLKTKERILKCFLNFY